MKQENTLFDASHKMIYAGKYR